MLPASLPDVPAFEVDDDSTVRLELDGVGAALVGNGDGDSIHSLVTRRRMEYRRRRLQLRSRRLQRDAHPLAESSRDLLEDVQRRSVSRSLHLRDHCLTDAGTLRNLPLG